MIQPQKSNLTTTKIGSYFWSKTSSVADPQGKQKCTTKKIIPMPQSN
jgi:hypothetical protein